MTDKQPAVNSDGIGFFGLLTIVFVTLKLTGHITWPWVWVLAPLWMPLLVVILIVLITLAVVASICGTAVIGEAFKGLKR